MTFKGLGVEVCIFCRTENNESETRLWTLALLCTPLPFLLWVMYPSLLCGLGHVTCSGQWTVTRHSGNGDFKWVYVVYHRSYIPAICYKKSILFYLVLRINTHETCMNLRHRLKLNPANLKTHKWPHKHSLWATEFSDGLLHNIILPITNWYTGLP